MRFSFHPFAAAFLAMLALLSAPLANSVHAQGVISAGISGCDFQTGQLSAACIPIFISYLIKLVFGFVGMFFMLNVLYAGYEIALGYIGAGVDKGAGKSRITWSIIGLIVTTCVYLILDLVLYVVLGS